jgi:hypothetical protein
MAVGSRLQNRKTGTVYKLILSAACYVLLHVDCTTSTSVSAVNLHIPRQGRQTRFSRIQKNAFLQNHNGGNCLLSPFEDGQEFTLLGYDTYNQSKAFMQLA